jgi:two-component system, chemotaxis family, response regulator Rcp1
VNGCGLGPPRVLLIDDNIGDVRLVTQALEAAVEDIEVCAVTDSTQAVAGLHAQIQAGHAPSLILLDLRMPKKSGLEILEEIKTDPKTTPLPVLVLTSSEAAQDVMGAYSRHANAVITKPLGFQELRAVVGALCDFWLRVAKLP